MNLRHRVATDCPITLRSGEERDRDFLAGIFTDVWAAIPEEDKTAILSRGFGQGITVDVWGPDTMQGFDGLSDKGGDIWLNRTAVDFHSRASLIRLAAHELAHKVDDAAQFAKVDLLEQPAKAEAFIARMSEPRRNTERRVATILKRWGYPAKAKSKPTQADKDRAWANMKNRMEAQP